VKCSVTAAHVLVMLSTAALISAFSSSTIHGSTTKYNILPTVIVFYDIHCNSAVISLFYAPCWYHCISTLVVMKHANKRQNLLCVIPGFRQKVDENFTLPGYYTVNSGNFLLTFPDNLLAPSSGVKMGPTGCPETSVINYHYSLCNNPEEHSSLLFRTYSGLIFKENTREESILHIVLYWVYKLYGYHFCTPCEQREDATAVLCWRQIMNTSFVNA
jgi:hypothetical protein